jgi:protein-tyrosine phosphatase
VTGAKLAPVRILFVCLGNICRSPTAEGALRYVSAQAAPSLSIEVDSAGTADYHIGSPPDSRSQRAALRRGIDISGLRARQVSRADFQRFDFVLAMDHDNLRELEAICPRNSRAQLRLFLSFAPETGRLDVPDPYYGDDRDFEAVLDLTMAASRGLVTALQHRAE